MREVQYGLSGAKKKVTWSTSSDRKPRELGQKLVWVLGLIEKPSTSRKNCSKIQTKRVLGVIDKVPSTCRGVNGCFFFGFLPATQTPTLRYKSKVELGFCDILSSLPSVPNSQPQPPNFISSRHSPLSANFSVSDDILWWSFKSLSLSHSLSLFKLLPLQPS